MDSRQVRYRLGRQAGIAVAAAALFAGGWACRERPGGAAAAEVLRLASCVGKEFGAAEAPIAVEACLPINNGCQDALGLYLIELARTHPSLLRVRIHDMKSPEGRAVMASKGVKCAAVFVQGTTTFDLGGETGKLLLEGPMDPFDVHKVLQYCVRTVAGSTAVLPEPPEGCSAPDPEERKKAGF